MNVSDGEILRIQYPWRSRDDNDYEESRTFSVQDDEYCSSLSQKLQGMREDDCMCDFTLTAETDGEKFRVHKLLLVLSSDFFKCLFEYEPSKIELTLSCDSTSLKSLIDFIYTGEVRSNIRGFFEIFRVADCYQIQSFCNKWLKYFKLYLMNEKRLILAFRELGKQHLTPMSNLCIDYLFNEKRQKIFSDEFLECMSAEVFADVLAREDVIITNSTGVLLLGRDFEFRLWEHVKRWLELHGDEQQRSLTHLAKSINFSSFTQSQKEAVKETCVIFGDLHLPDEVFQQPPDTDTWSNLVSKRRFCKPRYMKTISRTDYGFTVLKDEDTIKGAQAHTPDLSKVLKRIEFYMNSENAIQGICQVYEAINAQEEVDCVFKVGETTEGEPSCKVELQDNERIFGLTVCLEKQTDRILQINFETSEGRTIEVPDQRKSCKTEIFYQISQPNRQVRSYFSFIHSIEAKLDAEAGGLVCPSFHWAAYKEDAQPSAQRKCGTSPNLTQLLLWSAMTHRYRDDDSDNDFGYDCYDSDECYGYGYNYYSDSDY